MSRQWLLLDDRRAELRKLASLSHQVVTAAAIAGAATGIVVALFDRLVVEEAFARVARAPLWVIGVAPGVGLLLAALIRRLGGGYSPSTAEEYLLAFHDRHYQLGVRAFLVRMGAAVATLGSGAPMGLEGPSLCAGSTIGFHLQRRVPRVFRGADHRVLLVAGAAAGVAAIFKAPATGAVFALEVPYQDDLARRMLLPALIGGATGYLAFVAVNGTEALLRVGGNPAFSLTDLLGALAIGIIAGVGARVFAAMLRKAKLLAASVDSLIAAAGAGVGLAVVFVLGRVLTGASLMVGSGYQVVQWASQPSHSVPVLAGMLVLRCVGTSVAVAGGGVGGLFVPLVVAGALTGSLVGAAINFSDLSLFVVIGVAAFLGAGYRVPLAAVMFVAETTGRPSFVVPGLLASVAAELMMGTASVTKYQRIASLRIGGGAPSAEQEERVDTEAE